MDHSLAIVENGDLAEVSGLDAAVPWWSFTKTTIAATALALVRDGRLTLDQPLPNARYTLRQLLQHRAGLPDYGGLASYHESLARGDAPWSVSDLLARTQAHELRHEPGAVFSYSNIGYLLVRGLIEEHCGESLGNAISRLVLRPLAIAGPRIAASPADLADVAMGEANTYHPGWVYHGLMVGRLRDAALLLHRLITGALLPPSLLAQMRDAEPVSDRIPGRPWGEPGYGLGLMIGSNADGRTVIGHTGGGPGSVIAVYHLPEASSTVAAFAFGNDPGHAETLAFRRGAT
jgi:CubicO group peptidase (beta-lactamase class C family)